MASRNELEQCREAALGVAPVGHVLDELDEVQRVPGGFAHDGDRHLAPDRMAVAVQEALLPMGRCGSTRQQRREPLAVGGPIVGTDPLAWIRHPLELLDGPAEHRRERPVDAQRTAIRGCERHPLGGMREGGGEGRQLLAPQRCVAGPATRGGFGGLGGLGVSGLPPPRRLDARHGTLIGSPSLRI